MEFDIDFVLMYLRDICLVPFDKITLIETTDIENEPHV